MSKPNDGIDKNFGVGKNLFCALLNIKDIIPCTKFFRYSSLWVLNFYLADVPGGISFSGAIKENTPSSVETAKIIP